MRAMTNKHVLFGFVAVLFGAGLAVAHAQGSVSAPAASIAVVCPNISDVAQQLEGQFENLSQSEGINSASVTVQFSVTTGGQVSNPQVIYSTSPKLNSLALQGVKLLSCNGQGQTVQVTAPFVFGSD